VPPRLGVNGARPYRADTPTKVENDFRANVDILLYIYIYYMTATTTTETTTRHTRARARGGVDVSADFSLLPFVIIVIVVCIRFVRDVFENNGDVVVYREHATSHHYTTNKTHPRLYTYVSSYTSRSHLSKVGGLQRLRIRLRTVSLSLSLSLSRYIYNFYFETSSYYIITELIKKRASTFIYIYILKFIYMLKKTFDRFENVIQKI